MVSREESVGRSQVPSPMLSPYIAESLRRSALEAEQAKALAKVVHELVPHSLCGQTTAEKAMWLRRMRRDREKTYRNAARRRARLQEAAVVERVSRSEIIARDNRVCYLCGKACEPAEIHLDHVVPLSKGGVHSPGNVRVACASCNIRKGADLLPS